jgi:hypothetical protein
VFWVAAFCGIHTLAHPARHVIERDVYFAVIGEYAVNRPEQEERVDQCSSGAQPSLDLKQEGELLSRESFL